MRHCHGYAASLQVIFTDRRAAVSPMLALMMVPMIGAMGMATEASSWFLHPAFVRRTPPTPRRMAAASNGCDPAAASAASPQLSPTYIGPRPSARSPPSATIMSPMDLNNTVVAATGHRRLSRPVGPEQLLSGDDRPGLVPISLMRIVGYAGNTTMAGTGAPALSIVATARIANRPIPAGGLLHGRPCSRASPRATPPSHGRTAAPNANLPGIAATCSSERLR